MKIKRFDEMETENISESNATELAKGYDWDNDYEYFEYIEDSLINGNRSQVNKLFDALDKEGKKEYFAYAKENNHEAREYLIDHIFDDLIENY